MVAFLAALKAGIIAVPVFPPNPRRRDSLQMFSVIVKTANATFALTDTTYDYQTKLLAIKDAVSKLRRHAGWPENLTWLVTNKINNKIKDKTTPKLPKPPTPEMIAFLQFTSGSTSDPKGVMITHQNLAHNLTAITSDLQAQSDTVVVSWLPQYHDMGLIGSYLGALYCGGCGYYLSPLTFLQRPMIWLEAVSRFRATHLQAPNFAFKLTSRKQQQQPAGDTPLDLSSVRHIINAAEPVDTAGMQVFYDAFGKYGLSRVIFPTYGLAEHTVFVCSGGTQVLRVDKEQLEVHGNVELVETDDGRAVKEVVGCGYPSRQKITVEIVDSESGERVESGAVGEVWVDSPSKAAGYYGQPDESKRDFAAQNSGEGRQFLRTGDLGFLYQEELFICGRLKDLIIVGGRNYYPQDIEATAEASSELVRLGCSAAFSVDVSGEEQVVLIMELKEVPSDAEKVGTRLAESVRAAINQEHSLALSSVLLVKSRTIPKTSSGKIARAWCRKGFLAGTLSTVYRKGFTPGSSTGRQSMEIDSAAPMAPSKKRSAAEVRAMSKEELLESLKSDMRKFGIDASDAKAPMSTLMDSITIAQFKGLLEGHYAVQLSDDYLFRESTCLQKLVEVVKLGYAPDDGDGTAAAQTETPGQARGLAGALGCPPGVVCAIM